ncbi:YhjD/YihY/BrkB family envelope integrity protein [Thermodesulfobacteriota bacterium]
MISRIFKFIRKDIWRIRLRDLSKTKSIAVRLLRIILLATRGFDEDKIHLRASALTFYSLLSIVPVAAMAFGIAKGFGFEKNLEKQLLERFPAQEEIIMRVVDFANSLLETTKGGLVAGIGIVVLLWAVIRVLSNIENSFNDIWGIKKGRSFGRKFSDYLSIMFIGPILLIMSGSITVFITTQVTLITQKIALLGYFSFIIHLLLELLPYCVIWGLFTFIYILVPNTKVNFRSGVLAGIVAGSIYQLVQFGYITSQIGVAKYNAIYGSFAALPLFLIWLQISWLIVLFGAEIAFAHQNVDTYEFEPDSLFISFSFKTKLSLEISHHLAKKFSDREAPPTASDISHELEIPIRLVRQILYELVKGGILSEVNIGEDKQSGYQPAMDINLLTVNHVLKAMAEQGIDDLPVARTQELETLAEAMRDLSEVVEKAPSNKLLKDL